MVSQRTVSAQPRKVSRVGFAIFLAALALVGATEARAETVVTTELTLLADAERTDAGGIGFYNLSDGKFSLSSTGSAEVKGQLTVDLAVTDTITVDVTKAWVKARLADLRLTVGKTRLSWGEGAMYNAGDVIFNGKNPDLTAEDLRENNNIWLTALYLPLGDFSFIEAVLLPPDIPISKYIQYGQALALKQSNPSLVLPAMPTIAGFDSSSFGGRVYTKVGGLKVEAGYLWDGMDSLNKPYISLQGNLLMDFHLSSSIAIPANNPWTSDTPKNWQITGGLFYQVPLSSGGEDSGSAETPSSGSLNFRLETSVFPYGDWTPHKLTIYPFNPALPNPVSFNYALGIYPEISWKSDTIFAYLRGIWSPVDMSSVVSIGLQWGPLQGFKVLTGLSMQLGESGDFYGFDRARGWQFTVGTRVNF